MSENPHRADELAETNERLHVSLRQCKELVADLRVKLAANLNDPPIEGERDRPESAAD